MLSLINGGMASFGVGVVVKKRRPYFGLIHKPRLITGSGTQRMQKILIKTATAGGLPHSANETSMYAWYPSTDTNQLAFS